MKNKKEKLSWILMIAWIVFIFFMSNQSGIVSTKQSDMVVDVFNYLGIDTNRFGDTATFMVRKGAHFGEYMILCFLIYNVFRNYFDTKKILIYSIVGVFLYACTDEFHQLFVPGRECHFRDVLIDTSGGIFAAILIYIKGKIFNKKTHN